MNKTKKKLTKKLELSKETLRNLEPDKLQHVVGGIVTRAACYTLTGGAGTTC